MSQGLQLLLLGCACSLAPAMAMREVTVACSETADLPCTAPWDPQLSYKVSWAKLSEGGNQRMELLQSRQNNSSNSSEVSRTKSYSLTIQNTTVCSSGTYRCALQELGGRRNFSGTVILKVTGCPKEAAESPFRKYRAEAVLLFSLVIFYLTLIIFTCKFARLQSIFPDISKPGTEQAFLPVTSPSKHSGPVTLPKTETV
ncbi:CD83 antigen [Phodopus roborovskii]|uniref:Cd83 protein n=1 Tax=Phodopus roborovskii TaxID=109678 RepID=A0AAU9ZN38_PHORO|nr:CD83 antigen [Phodopus roborovskii]CAH6801141.1 Cd83 [Phodopus roborovskii]